MNNKTYSLFESFQSTITNAVRIFLNRDIKPSSDKPVATSLRIPHDLKDFYECLAQAENTSINTAIISTLNKVKEQTVESFNNTHSKINCSYDYQLESFFKIIDAHKIDYNDLPTLMSYLTQSTVSRGDLANKEGLINLLNKSTALNLCKMFSYSYNWFKNRSFSINYSWDNFNDRWYKNVVSVVTNIVRTLCVDSTVQSCRFSILCSDRNLIKNIVSEHYPDNEEMITPIIEIERSINGVNFKTYHCLESNNINYEKCRKHFIVLNKMMYMLNQYRIMSFPNAYVISLQEHDMVRDGSMHPVELFNKHNRSNSLNLEDILHIEPRSLHPKPESKTATPNLYHALDSSFLTTIMTWTGNSDETIILTNELCSKIGMSYNEVVNYLHIFSLADIDSTACIYGHCNDDVKLNLKRVKEVSQEMREQKYLDTEFG